MKASKTFKIIGSILLLLVVAAYVVYAMLFMTKDDTSNVCREVVLTVEENPRAGFIDKDDVENMLKSAHIYPKGLPMAKVDTKRIEDIIKSNNFVEGVECYKTADGEIKVDVIQRTPVIYILPDNGKGYYIDMQGKVIPNTNYTANIITATGQIDQNYATKQLMAFGLYLQDNPFWDNQIEQIYVTIDKERRHNIEIVPRVGEHIVYLGTIDNFEKKLRRLRTFYEKGLSEVGWNKYKRISLEYDNQIICTKK